LELLNPGDTARDLQIDLWDDLSHHVAEHRVQVAPHGAMRIWLRQLFPGEGGRARLLGGIVDGRQEVQAKVFWGIDVRSRTELSVATEAHTEHVIEGPATGLGGHSLTIINPFETTAKVTLTRTVDGVSAREELTIGPLGRRPRAWVVKPTQRQLRVAVLGDPVVTQPQRWDPQLRVMR
jgi:hypothetical protein